MGVGKGLVGKGTDPIIRGVTPDFQGGERN